MKQLIKIALLCLFPVLAIAQTPAYQRNPRALRVTDGSEIIKWKDSLYYKAELGKKVDTFSNQNIRGKKIFIDNVSLIDTSSIDTIPSNNSQLALSRFYTNEPIRFFNQYDANLGRTQIFATGLLDGNYSGAAGDITAGWLKWNTTGTKGNINGLMLQLAPGYTGIGTTRVIDAQNYIGGASTFNAYDMSGNVGLAAESQGLSIGDNVGVYGIAGFAKGRNISGFFRATQDASDYQSTNKVGVFGLAGILELDSGYNIGGVFSLQQWQDVKTILNTNAALIANNGDMPHPIFLGKVSGEDVFKIKRYGDVSIKSIGLSDVTLQVKSDSLNTNDIVKYYKGNLKYGSFSRFGDFAMRGRLLFYDNGDTTSTVQALYVDSSTGRTVIRAGTRANKVGIYNSTASAFVDFDGSTSSMKLGGTVQAMSAPTDGARIGGAVIVGTTSDTGEKLQVDGVTKSTSFLSTIGNGIDAILTNEKLTIGTIVADDNSILLNKIQENKGIIREINITSSSSQTLLPSSGQFIGAFISPGIAANNTQNWTGATGFVGVINNPRILSGSTGDLLTGSSFRGSGSLSGMTVGSWDIYRSTSPGGNSVITNFSHFKATENAVRATNNTNFLVGTQATGNWNIYTSSSYNNYFGTGNTLINTTTDNGAKLQVQGAATVSSAPTVADGVLRLTDLGTGWAQYSSNTYTVGSPLVILSGATTSLPNNGSTTITTQLPIGVTSFLNTSTGKITPQLDGDFYNIEVRFKAKSNSPNGRIKVAINIGGAMGVIREKRETLSDGVGIEQLIAVPMMVYSGSTFVANGGSIDVTSLVGDTSIYDITFVIDRTHKAK